MPRLSAKSFLFMSFCLFNRWIPLARAQNAVTSLPLTHVSSVAWDATRARFFVGSGSNILVVDPEGGKITDTISVGSKFDQIALSDDGKYVYASVPGSGTIQRIRVQDHGVDSTIS